MLQRGRAGHPGESQGEDITELWEEETVPMVDAQPKGRWRKRLLLPSVMLLILAMGIAIVVGRSFQQSVAQADRVMSAVTDCGEWHVLSDAEAEMVSVLTELTAADALGKDDVWFVGTTQTLLGGRQFISARWDGKGMSTTLWPLTGVDKVEIGDLDVHSANDAWAVGSALQGNRASLFAMRWDGQEWRAVSTPNSLTGADGKTIALTLTKEYAIEPSLNAVTIISEDDVWAVGSYSIERNAFYQPIVLHWDGKEWEVISTSFALGSDMYLSDIVSLAKEDVWAFGSDGSKSLVMHWDGKAWQIADNPPKLGTIGAASVDRVKNIWAIHVTNSGGNSMGSAIKRMGSNNWEIIEMPYIPQPILISVAAYSPTNVWAAGSTEYSGLVLHWDGEKWEETPAPDAPDMQRVNAITVASEDEVWAVGRYYEDEGLPVYAMIARMKMCAKEANK